MLTAAIVTTCKGRLSYLQQCVPSWLSQDALLIDYRIYVVDFGCPDGAADWCDQQGEPRVTAIRVVNNTEFFNQPRARNIGMRRAIADGAGILASVDADVQLPGHFLRRYVGTMIHNNWELCKVETDAGEGRTCFVGTSVVTARLFDEVRGYDEALRGYGHDDTDFYWRCERAAPDRVGALSSDLIHLPNNDDERVRFYCEKDLRASINANFAVVMDRERAVNCGEWGSE